MEREKKAEGGIYYALIHLGRVAEIEVGALGTKYFAAGYYVYTGSAQRGLRARIERHGRRKKVLRWHIDYLTVRGQVVEVKAFGAGKEAECGASAEIGRLPGARLWVKGFGASDCRCEGHLYYFTSRPSLPRSLDSWVGSNIIRHGGGRCQARSGKRPKRRG